MISISELFFPIVSSAELMSAMIFREGAFPPFYTHQSLSLSLAIFVSVQLAGNLDFFIIYHVGVVTFPWLFSMRENFQFP